MSHMPIGPVYQRADADGAAAMSVASRPLPMSGVGVLDKASMILSVVEQRPASLAQVVAISGLPRPTVYRIATALERLELLTRDAHGRFLPGARIGHSGAAHPRDRLEHIAEGVLAELHTRTGLNARVHRRRDAVHICVASSSDPVTGQDAVPLGTARPAKSGPVAQVLLAWEDPDELYAGLRGARFNAAQLALVRQRGWAHGPDVMVLDEYVLAVPVRDGDGRVSAALVLSGPRARMAKLPERGLRNTVIDAAAGLTETLPRPSNRPRPRLRSVPPR
ncbi:MULTISPECIES: IclR family transcriptional regulator [Streptomyces]|nr:MULTISPECIES: helix-turn-helix domain-containing protein [Streptomyces]ALF39549.1 Has3 [Streptomyces sp. LZ35]ATL86031.1 IclR-type transcriptional regulator [Streptomyces malaysiensis]MCC4318444.1 helix-turn-helix domain-containing protein [Streptomyces malaysiensis]MCD9590946.1 helix-turn-helix domain-containing protein [Streptomyces sp. 8ZJF_21]MCQ8836361.1 helix-turn-helix domain-containing protein [Streptomyces samsunensis]